MRYTIQEIREWTPDIPSVPGLLGRAVDRTDSGIRASKIAAKIAASIAAGRLPSRLGVVVVDYRDGTITWPGGATTPLAALLMVGRE